jgi:hypothetical protein
MSSDLSIGPTSSSPVVRAADTVQAASLSTVSAEATASPGTPNPTLRLDPALGLVVIEFLSKSGAVTSSIPSQRQLTAYQDGTAEPPGEQPATVHRKA